MPVTIRLPALFTDHMVIQREQTVPVWGWTSPGVTVTATLATVTATATSDAQGRFRIDLPPQLASGPHMLTVASSEGARRIIADVQIGEVWLCSGQSNMEWPTRVSGYSDTELAAIDNPRIRLFQVPQTTALEVQDDVRAAWKLCDAQGVGDFSGLAYAFACDVARALGVTVGLVQSAWGGTSAEWWTPISALEAHPELKPIVDRHRAAPPAPKAGTPEYAAVMRAWEQNAVHQDPGNKGESWGWAAPGCDLGEWQQMTLPQYWEATGLNIDGAVWFRRTAEIPATWLGQDLVLSLGPIDDFDTTYVMGEQVGAIGKETANAHVAPRVYTVPGRLVTATTLAIAVRVFDHLGNGGIYGSPAAMRLSRLAEPDKGIPLAGRWHYRVELALAPKAWSPPPETSDSPSAPERLWNGMLRPLAPYAIRGALWYQGESNAERAEQYRILMATLITTWRKAWGYDFPFYQVQLAPFMMRREQPQESAWAELREAQEQVTADLPGCDLAVIIDSGDEADIHPRNKPLVGRRLARIALARDYRQDIEHSGPRVIESSVVGERMIIRFAHCSGGLAAFGGPPLRGFAIAGQDRAFVWAQATISADTVTVSSPDVAAPVAVRYAWADFPQGNLVNQDGLPARPFRTDRWPGVTTGKR